MIAGIGIIVLFWSVFKVLANIEQSFNEIWERKKGRTLWRKFSDYFAMMLISPILFITSGSATVFITTEIASFTNRVALIGFLSPVIFFLLKLTPYVLMWALFTFVYLVMPNLKVNFRSGLVAGIAAGTLYQLVQSFYISFQVLVAKYNAIYGSFAALPLFLIWLQLSWLIVLFGAEISFAHQNVDTYEFEPDRRNISNAFKKRLSIHVVHLLVNNFIAGAKPPTAVQISHLLEIPIRLVRQILSDLVESGLVTELEGGETEEPAYQPARDVNQLSIKYVIDALERNGLENIHIAQSDELARISASLQTLGEVIANSPANKLLKDI
jgi:membrane protein